MTIYMKSFLLIPNLNRDIDLSVTLSAAGHLNRSGCVVAVPLEYIGERKLPEYIKILADNTSFSEYDAFITFGGDGTILHIAKIASLLKKPILGVNTGKLGFMTEIEPSELFLLDELIRGEFTCEERMMLHVDLVRNNGKIYTSHALNDVVIANGEIHRPITLSVLSNNKIIKEITGDGVIIASPTGSTA